MTASGGTTSGLGFGERMAKAAAVFLDPRVLIILLLGFSSGLPLALSASTLLAVDEGCRRRSQDHRPVRAGRHALHHQVPVGAAGRCISNPGARSGARPPARLAGIYAAIADRGAAVPRRAGSRRVAVDGGAGCSHSGHRFGHPGHRHRCFPYRVSADREPGGGHGLFRRGLSHRHAGLDRRRRRAGCLSRIRRHRSGPDLVLWLCRHGGLGAGRPRRRLAGARAASQGARCGSGSAGRRREAIRSSDSSLRPMPPSPIFSASATRC